MDFIVRIPWRVKVAANFVYQHFFSLLSQLTSRRTNGFDISFYCNYQQITGSTIAIASIANHLAKTHHVDVYIKPWSGYPSLLDLDVALHLSPERLTGNLVFTDIEQDNSVVNNLTEEGKKVVLSCHAFPTTLHSVPQNKLLKILELATYIHFVSNFQRTEFIRHCPHIDIESKSFVIPNYTRQSAKQSITGNIGIVGHLNRSIKNGLKGIQLGQQSNAKLIQCWGSDTIADLDNPGTYTKLRINGWSSNMIKIHESFDVLLSTSQSETFGLVVVEALSAGIPCVVSDIPVFRELFSECGGVVFISGNDQRDIESINLLLDQATTLKRPIIEFWESRFSNEVIRTAWLNKLSQLNESL